MLDERRGVDFKQSDCACVWKDVSVGFADGGKAGRRDGECGSVVGMLA